MKRVQIALVAAFLSLTQLQIAQAAGTWRNRAYDATYTMTNAYGSGTWRMAADGLGHALVDIQNAKSGSSLMLFDSATNSCYVITGQGANRMAMKSPMNDNDRSALTAEELRKRQSTPLGIKVVAGHPAHGFRYRDAAGGVTDSWMADDIDFMAQSASNHPKNGTTSMVLKSFSPRGPAASSFSLPAGVKIVDYSALSKGDYSGLSTPGNAPNSQSSGNHGTTNYGRNNQNDNDND